jgi:hypothetical protein
MEFIEDFYSETLETEVKVFLTWYDYDVETHYLDFEWEAQDETGKDVTDEMSADEQDQCEAIARKYAKSL